MAKKQKKKNYIRKEQMIFGGIFAAVLLAVAALLISLVVSNSYYVKVDGKTISVNELKLYMYEFKAYFSQFGITDWDSDFGNGSTVRENIINYAVNTVVDNKILLKEAERRGITLTDEQKQEASERLAEYKASITEAALKDIKMSDNDLINSLEEQMRLDALTEQIMSVFEFNQADFDSYFASYQVTNRQDIAIYNVDYVSTYDEASAQVARERLLSGEDYPTVFMEMSGDYQEGVEIASKSVTTLYFPQEVVDAVYELTEIDSAIEPMETDSGWVVAVLRSIEEPNLEELQPSVQEQYEQEQRQAIYDAELTELREASDISVNGARVYSLTFAPETLVTPEPTIPDMESVEPEGEVADPGTDEDPIIEE